MALVFKRHLKTKAMHGHNGGIWYLVKLPKKWQLICYRFINDDDNFDHSQFWETTVAPLLAKEWKLSKGKQAELRLLVYGFPRGRLVRSKDCWTVFNGEDFHALLDREAVISAFDLGTKTRFVFDDHQQCQLADQKTLQNLLKLEERWPAIDHEP